MTVVGQTICGTGSYNDGVGNCIACPAGTFNAVGNNAWCLFCPTGTKSLAGSTACWTSYTSNEGVGIGGSALFSIRSTRYTIASVCCTTLNAIALSSDNTFTISCFGGYYMFLIARGPSAYVNIIAGGYPTGFADSTTGTSARVSGVSGIAISPDMKFALLADSGNNRIRYMSLTAPYPVSTLAGTGSASNGDNANGLLASLWTPYSICFTPVRTP
jgi:Tyrosine-protein kinase ephrin type A/B receptor-like